MRVSIFLLTALLAIPVKGNVSDSINSDKSEQSTYQQTVPNHDTKLIQDHSIDSNKIPFRKENLFAEASLMRVLLVTIIGLLLVIFSVYVLKRFYFKQPLSDSTVQNIKLLAVKRLTPKLTLSIVQVNDKEYVLAQSGDNLVSLESSKMLNPTENEIN
ncbi:hypothetical protein A3194_12405 [Candidatus Thiodiazotropha endoloripes]|uniref:flagellar biosynthetic protein FliO n=1 Tax=Candidatus Thiodiazotropha endoloripes TaxID=1818881 RepID=UPI00083D1BF6|nr:flagellar biosynthetic protein FliO [Candidatus Thiodiazotropha endoloripes]ODB85629.1 hypothetical protein A3194_12405 [Candidatus Thiodiazotropha endoloripes]